MNPFDLPGHDEPIPQAFDIAAELERVAKKTRPGGNGQKNEPPLQDEPPPIWTPDLEIQFNKAPPIEFVTLENIFTEKIEEKPIIKDFLNEEDGTIIYSPGGVGKSLLCQDIAMALGSGIKSLWGMFDIPKDRVSIFFQSENSRLPVHKRTILKCEGNKAYLSGLQNVIYPMINKSIQIAGHISEKKFRNRLIDIVKTVEEGISAKIDIIIWDPLISYHDADENDNSRMRTTLDHINEVSYHVRSTPIVVAHANKDGVLRGATAIFDWARNVIKLENADYQGEKKIRLTNEKSNNSRAFDTIILSMDEHLNFTGRSFAEAAPGSAYFRGLKVKEALDIIGARAETKEALILQYQELTGITAIPTIHRHIDEAVKYDHISRQYYREKNIKKARYWIPIKDKFYGDVG